MRSLRPPFLRAVLVALCFVLLAVATTGEAKRKGGSAAIITEALALAEENRAQAIADLEAAIKQNPSAVDVTTLMVHAGEQHRLAGNTTAARDWFRKVALREPTGPVHDMAELGLLLLDAPAGVDARLVTMLEASPERNVLATQNADRYALLALASARVDDEKALVSYAKRALTYAESDREVRARVSGQLQGLVDAAQNRPPSDGRDDGGDDGPRGSKLTSFEQAGVALDAGELDDARAAANEALMTATPEQALVLQRMLKVIDAGPPDRNKIGVLLPLSGKYAAVGKQIREALEFGYAGGPRQLIVLDSGATKETALAALEQAVLSEHVIAVVGPLLMEETDEVIAAAEAMHVPLLSLSSAYEDTASHRWALQAMYTRGDQINALLTYVMAPDRLEGPMASFAVFAPNSPIGLRTATQFREAVEARGGRIATEATYSAEEQNLLPYAKQLGVREGDIDQLRRDAVQAGGKAASVVIPPKLDFDGIFLPENATRTPLACAALAFEEFPMGDFTPRRGQKKIPLLGLNGWNTPNLVATGNEYTRNSLFTDVFSPSIAGEADPFVVAYRAALARAPTPIEAATVDAGKLLALAARSQATTRPQFLDALLAANVPDGVTGLTRINPETRRASRQMYILTITRTSVSQLARLPLD